MLDVFSAHPAAAVEVAVSGFALQFVGSHTIAGHYDNLVRRAEKWQRGGEPKAGFGAFQGRVVSTNERALAGGTLQEQWKAARSHPVVCHVRHQRDVGNNVWMDVRDTWDEEPFHLALADETELLVHPERPRLSGFEEIQAPAGTSLRTVSEKVYPGETVWVTGYLEPPPKGMGAYRGGSTRRALRAPKGGKVWITRKAPADEWRILGGAHRSSGFTALVCLFLAVLVSYAPVIRPLMKAGTDATLKFAPQVIILWSALVIASLFMWIRAIRKARRTWARRYSFL
ncbi:MAG: hypothetical protein U0441_37625 [Polyangiaceae bacterium]